ncbi:unnamed protein product [Acanthoscelides obtectus]|uniref:Paired domain-containing protein n=1 Tax=Acanthoscelides obtectus TaxID=200917 RepID=A0A9P0Q7G4_ACAOB|nr:unnamed protein product [Acanthoscelides obtectus]CAK1660309.1 hypothetical protein AOBTE_LOCUS21980 [Acanthoscelides obtectus]
MARGSTLNLQIKKLIILKYLSGIKQATIAKQLNLSRSVICKAIKLFRLRKSLVSPPKTGRPRKTTPRIDRKIKTLALKNPCTTAVDIKAQLKENTGLCVVHRNNQVVQTNFVSLISHFNTLTANWDEDTHLRN